MNIKEKAYGIIAELAGIDSSDIRDSDLLIDGLGFDSLALVELLIIAEDRFGIILDESDLNPLELKTADDFVRLVRKYAESGESI